jgi:hypothetical protein
VKKLAPTGALSLLGSAFLLSSAPAAGSAVVSVARITRVASIAAANRVASGHVAFGTCKAHEASVQVSLSQSAFPRSAPVTFTVTARNVGTASCSYTASGDTTASQTAGPCGTFSAVIKNSKGVNVWPGTAVFHCPMLTSKTLAPGASVTARGSWDQESIGFPSPTSKSSKVTPGHYRIIVNGKLSLPFTLRS